MFYCFQVDDSTVWHISGKFNSFINITLQRQRDLRSRRFLRFLEFSLVWKSICLMPITQSVSMPIVFTGLVQVLELLEKCWNSKSHFKGT